MQGGGQGWIGSALPMASSVAVFDKWEVRLRTPQKDVPTYFLMEYLTDSMMLKAPLEIPSIKSTSSGHL